MNHETTSQVPGTSESSTGRTVVPMWLIVLTVVLMFGGAIYFDSSAGGFDSNVYAPYHNIADLQNYQLPLSSGPDLRRGESLFAVCAGCHNTDGKGKPNQAPPLAGSDWVQGSPERLIRIPLAGLQGPIEVSGQKYNFPAGMTSFNTALSDDDLAAILSYIRQAWGNKGGEITSEQVKDIRAKVGNRTKQWTPEELKAFP
jgi:mono/diheme cytochrome c family protein